MRLRILRQFIKFCLVGATSFAIHFGTYLYLLQQDAPAWIAQMRMSAGLTPQDVYMLLANSVGFSLAVTNGFIWNRLWTFRGAHVRGTRTQYVLFVLVNIVGLAISGGILFLMVGLLRQWGYPEMLARKLGQPIALPAVALWNFTANRYWTFAAPPGD
jgi:putative flippase GtrA